MRRVITISLNGNAYALEDDAADALGTYLDQARRALDHNADRIEILSDLEQAIADKSQRFLGSHKTVLNRTEIEQILAEMGPVDGGSTTEADATSSGTAPGPSAPRRHTFYRIRQDQKVGGVCNGLAAYFGWDVTWVRLAFLVFGLLWGITGVIYLALMIIVPVAETPEELAAAYGEPFNARELIERARQEAEELTRRDWGQEKAQLKAGWERSKSFVRTELRESLSVWRKKRLDARRRRRQSAQGAAQNAGPAAASAAATNSRSSHRPGPIQQILTFMLLVPLIAVFGGLALAWIAVVFVLLTTGTIFGFLLPLSWPIWLVILVLFFGFSLITWPFRLLRQMLAPTSQPAAATGAFAFIESLVGIVACIALASWAYHHLPAVTDMVDHLMGQISLWLEEWRAHGLVRVET